ncbi:ATP-dependent helicase [Geobacter sp. DSM 9736]|uniref:ATP-dependent helicase n=1 Tax=Geobacter sp. DSM 9736 TaxID=1277350 RepID=UPI000B514AB3|nr:UvrD-helicase domain-containing protein [Geobacter sp. DSM 9736]SNB47990.1 ATP-dependent DNA helicase Rep/DNA helicase-2 / ATP-dependent DNA helicase PcrA [Geobacter sp. DSM 9736]
MLDLRTLNPQQLAAVKHTEGPLLVLAGAGSGKTKVITCRIGHLLEKGVPADRILAVTFTNKAAKEMQERVRELVGKARCEGMIIATFHSLCVRILRREIGLLGYKKNFSIYSTSDQLGLVRQAMRDAGVDAKKIDGETILWKISAAKNALVPPERYQPGTGEERGDAVAAVYSRYQSALKACNAVDFDDIIMLTVEILRRFPEALSRWQEHFQYIMVDEYQDTNPSQYLLIHLLAEKHRNLCVVGDDDQSIYGWRGADVEKILAFEHDYTGCRVVKLEQNYRSLGNILEAANSVIRNNGKRKEKSLWTSSGSGRLIDLIVTHDEEEEASTVVERIQAEAFKHNMEYGDFAILYRTNAQSRAFEEQLRFESIPYILIGGMQFFERKEVKDTISYLKVLDNPQDEQSLLRIVNFPRRGIGDSTIVKINQWSARQECTLFEALGRAAEVEDLGEQAREKVLGLHRFLTEQAALFSDGENLAEKARDLLKKVGIEEELYRTVEDRNTARRKVENVEQVVNSFAAYEERSTRPTLSGFLEKVSLMDEDRFSGKDKKEPERNAVTLMSLHSSKGLEFPCVFLVGLEEEILPHKRSIEVDFTIDEERRLCYVGITRARKHLVITRCLHRKKYGKLEERTPSRFLDEIPEHLLACSKGAAAAAATEEEADKMANDFFAKMRGMLG